MGTTHVHNFHLQVDSPQEAAGPAMSDEHLWSPDPGDNRPPDAGVSSRQDLPQSDNPADVPRIWGPSPVFVAIAVMILAGTIIWLIFARSPEDQVFAGLLAIGALLATVAAVMMRSRLVASSTGLRVGTMFGTKLVAWSQVHRIQITVRRHLGIGSEMLHLDLDEDGLFIFGRIDLGADPEEVADELRRIQRIAHRFD